MLNAKGRVMFDIMLYDVGEGETVIECDRGIMDKVFKHLKMYKIRKQMTLEREPNEFTIGHVLGWVYFKMIKLKKTRVKTSYK